MLHSPTLLAYIAPDAAAPVDVTLFTRADCEYCVRAKKLLDDASIRYEEMVLNRDYSEATLRAISGAATVPQVFINGEHIGGSTDLEAYMKASDQAAQATGPDRNR